MKVTDEMVRKAEQTLTFRGYVGTRLPGTESVDVRQLLEAAVCDIPKPKTTGDVERS